ncbi:MAG: hypothetical protein QOE70_3674 [Chthoniobacter sp.]|jgi:hypothetical protein|nr:hypothetical protein [Chthoniobacter sp.]
MNEEPSPEHVARVRNLILATFDVSPQTADEQAHGLAALAEGWGGEGAQQHDWAYTVKKRLGESLRWRSEAERAAFYSERQQIVRSYEHYIQQNKRA